MIPFTLPTRTGNEDQYVQESIHSKKMSGDGPFSHKCHSWFETTLGCKRALLTPSCTQALELAALLIGVEPGDEIIMPSYTFVSTANAFVLRGAKIVFVDINPETLNIDETLIEAAISERTRAIVPVHYAGVACEMGKLMELADRYALYVIEDAAQGMLGKYKGRPLGTIGHFGAYSFHETKNYTSGGEGGLLIVNDEKFVDRAEIMREKGTNRSQFFRGAVDKYSWVDVGSSYLLSDLQAAYLWGQLEYAHDINDSRLEAWNFYSQKLKSLADDGLVECQTIPEERHHNAHMYFIKTADIEERTALLTSLKQDGIQAAFHYVPLHSAPAGYFFGRFHGQDRYTSLESERLIRLPLWHGISIQDQEKVVNSIKKYYT